MPNVRPLVRACVVAVAIAVGLRTAASSSIAGIEDAAVAALAKLDQVLPPRLRSRVQALGTAIVRSPFRGPAEGVVDAGALATIAQACRDRDRAASPRARPVQAVKSTCANGDITARSMNTVATAGPASWVPAVWAIAEPK